MIAYNKRYSLGIYVNDWGYMAGSEGNPHVFLSLKIEKTQCNDRQIAFQKERVFALEKSPFKENLFSQIRKEKQMLKEMECFVSESALEDLRKALSEKYTYTFVSHKNFKAWQDTSLNLQDSFNQDFDKGIREALNKDFIFLRQCYADITEPFFIWVKNIKNRDDNYLQNKMSFDEFESLFNEFIESSYSNIESIEGFFGFGPYETKLFNKYENNDYTTGGKVFQNNHWNDKFMKKAQNEYEKIKEELKNKSLPRIPLNTNDKQYLIYSKDFMLTSLRPLKTFQEQWSEVFEIYEGEYIKVSQQILFQTLLTSDTMRQNSNIFQDDRNIFRDYKVVGNSCVDFVFDKLNLIGAGKFIKAVSILPHEVLGHVRDNKPNFYNKQKGIYKKPLSKGDKISLLLYDLHLFYQNYATLCQIDSTWDCEKGLRAFSTYCYSTLHSSLLDDTKLNRLGEHKIEPLPRDNAIENIADDIAMRINTGLCINAYFQDVLQYDNNLMCDVALLCVKELNGKQRFVKADSQSDFIYQDFDFASDNEIIQKSYNVAMDRQQPIIFAKIPHHNVYHISKESKGVYIQSFLERYAGQDRSIGDYRDILESKETHNA